MSVCHTYLLNELKSNCSKYIVFHIGSLSKWNNSILNQSMDNRFVYLLGEREKKTEGRQDITFSLTSTLKLVTGQRQKKKRTYIKNDKAIMIKL